MRLLNRDLLDKRFESLSRLGKLNQWKAGEDSTISEKTHKILVVNVENAREDLNLSLLKSSKWSISTCSRNYNGSYKGDVFHGIDGTTGIAQSSAMLIFSKHTSKGTPKHALRLQWIYRQGVYLEHTLPTISLI